MTLLLGQDSSLRTVLPHPGCASHAPREIFECQSQAYPEQGNQKPGLLSTHTLDPKATPPGPSGLQRLLYLSCGVLAECLVSVYEFPHPVSNTLLFPQERPWLPRLLGRRRILARMARSTPLSNAKCFKPGSFTVNVSLYFLQLLFQKYLFCLSRVETFLPKGSLLACCPGLPCPGPPFSQQSPSHPAPGPPCTLWPPKSEGGGCLSYPPVGLFEVLQELREVRPSSPCGSGKMR